MGEELTETLKQLGFLDEGRIKSSIKEAESFGITVTLREEGREQTNEFFSRMLVKLKNLIKSQKLLHIVNDLAFVSLFRLEFAGRTLSIFDGKVFNNILYRVFVAHNTTDILKLISVERYFDSQTNLLKKIFLLSHIKFFSTDYIDSLQKDPLFEEVFTSPNLREFLFFSDIKKKKYMYDNSVVNFAVSLQRQYPTVFEFLAHLDSYLRVQESMVKKGHFGAKKQNANLKTDLIKRSLQFLANQRKIIHLLATKDTSDAKFHHLASCLNFIAQVVGSMHKQDPLKNSRQAFLSQFLDFKEPASVQIQLVEHTDPQKEIQVNFFDPLEFDIELENVIKKMITTFEWGNFNIRSRKKQTPELSWSEAKPFLMIPKKDSPITQEETLKSGGLTPKHLLEYRSLLIEDGHPAKKSLDQIFSKSRATAHLKNLESAGFSILEEHNNGVLTLSHQDVLGYTIDVVLDAYVGCSEKTRFLSAIQVLTHLKQQIIAEKCEGFFTTAKQWVYLLPVNPAPLWWIPQDRKLIVLIREKLNELPASKNALKWRELSDERVYEALIKFACKTGLKLKNKQLKFVKEGQISFSPYSLMDKQDQFSFFLKRINPSMIPFCQKIIENELKQRKES